jgi:hypothetical protein
MKRFIAILAFLAMLLSCNPNLTTEVKNNSSYPVTAVISGGKTLTLPPGKSDEIDRGDTVRSFTADPPRVSLRAVGDDYEFYDTDEIDLKILVLNNLTGSNDVRLYTSGTTDDYTGSPILADPIIILSGTTTFPVTAYKIFTTTPALRAVVVSGTDEYPVSVDYVYNAQTNTMFVTIR